MGELCWMIDIHHDSWCIQNQVPGTPKRVRSVGCWLVDQFFRCLHSTARTKPPTHPIGFAEMLCIHDRFTSLHSNRKCRYLKLPEVVEFNAVFQSHHQIRTARYHMIWWSTNGQQGFAQIDVISDHALVFGTFCNPKHEAKILRANTPYDNSHLAYVGVVRTLSRCKTLAKKRNTYFCQVFFPIFAYHVALQIFLAIHVMYFVLCHKGRLVSQRTQSLSHLCKVTLLIGFRKERDSQPRIYKANL